LTGLRLEQPSPCIRVIRESIFKASSVLGPLDTIAFSEDIALLDSSDDDIFGPPPLSEGEVFADASLFPAEDSSETSWGPFPGPEEAHPLNLNWASYVLDVNQNPFDLWGYNEHEESAEIYGEADPYGSPQPLEDDPLDDEEIFYSGGELWI
jgi:hypothetical protein